jgi:polyferredoxin
MDHIDKPKGLIRYASENNIAQKQKTTYTWRLKLYTGVLALLLSFLAVLLITRDDVSARVLRTPGQMYQKLPENKISNLYNIKLTNKTRRLIHLDLKLENIEGEIKLINPVDVPKESYYQTSFFVILKNRVIRKRKTELKIGLYNKGSRVETVSAIFIAPSL